MNSFNPNGKHVYLIKDFERKKVERLHDTTILWRPARSCAWRITWKSLGSEVCLQLLWRLPQEIRFKVGCSEHILFIYFLQSTNQNSLASSFEMSHFKVSICAFNWLYNLLPCVLRFQHPYYWVLNIEMNPIWKGTKEQRINSVSQCGCQNKTNFHKKIPRLYSWRVNCW